MTDNNNRTNQELKHIFAKQGFALGAPGSALWAFQKNATGYSPTSPLTLSISDEKILSTLIENIKEQEDVQEIYTTTDVETVSEAII